MKYYFKVWLFTVLVSPLLVLGALVLERSGNFNDFLKGLPIWLFALIFGSAFALPSLFLFRLLNNDLSTTNLPVYLKKLIHAIVSVVLLWITFFYLNPTIFKILSWDNMIWPVAYSFTLVIGAFIFKINKEESSH